MKFGHHQYQHRFYKPTPNSRNQQNFERRNNTFHDNSFTPTPQYFYDNQQFNTIRKSTLPNQIGFGLKPIYLKNNQLGWNGYKLIEQSTHHNAQEYLQNANILERFRREAEQSKKIRRRYNQENLVHENDNILYPQTPAKRSLRHKTEPNQYLHQQIQFPRIKETVYLENPQKIIKYYDVGINAQLETERVHRQVDSKLKIFEEKEKKRSYKKKYQHLKKKIEKIHFEERVEAIAKRSLKMKEQQMEGRQIENIQHMLVALSSQLANNSKLINKTLQAAIVMHENKNNSTLHKLPPSKRKSDIQINGNQEHQLKQTLDLSQSIFEETIAKTPQVQYQMSEIDLKYQELQRINQQIALLKNRKKH